MHFSHCCAVSILLAASVNFIYICLFETVCCLCPSPLSQVCLAWPLTRAVVCGEETSEAGTGRHSASSTDKWGIGFQCGKEDGEGQEWLIAAELAEITVPDGGNRASVLEQRLWARPHHPASVLGLAHDLCGGMGDYPSSQGPTSGIIAAH